MSMASPLRSLSRAVAAAALAFSVALAPVTAQAQEGLSLIRDTEIEAILLKDSDPILRAAGIDPSRIDILLIGSKELNAFAAPGTMGVFTGLILESENPNQLQGVIAHEVGHLAAGHSARSGEMQQAGMRPFLLTMGLGVLAAFAGAGDAAVALMGSAGQFGTLAALGYSREQEGRADQAGLGLLDKAGISGRGLVEFFDKFRYQEVFQEARRYAYFRSHPLSSDRIERLRSKAETLPDYDKVDSEEALAEHAIMKAKLQGFINPQRALIDYSEKDDSYPARYARAIAYYQTKDPDRAIRMIDELLLEQPENPYLWELKGQILFEFARAPEAEAPQRKSVELMPEAPLLRINLGQTLIALNDEAKLEEGIAELRKALTQENDNAVAWRLLAEAYDRSGDDGRARLATAEYNFHIGDEQQARVFAMRAREMLTKDTPEWRRATDIVLTSDPSREDLRELAQEGAIRRGQIR
ncbi:M48 family metalloprotease [Phenylobacterium sp.]|uniref:M48 family metalloprotease n=2 Tax=Phenylobacterium sp. TaxID=1871053 RepID=UPI0008C6D101|nr:M48 family metallopeptidase [Phenylobacterium sp.]OHB34635.1 MAG: peptidase M48 [Phenylobacterium sp. RIFCSPHIGHO2_01_FULL_70_10]